MKAFIFEKRQRLKAETRGRDLWQLTEHSFLCNVREESREKDREREGERRRASPIPLKYTLVLFFSSAEVLSFPFPLKLCWIVCSSLKRGSEDNIFDWLGISCRGQFHFCRVGLRMEMFRLRWFLRHRQLRSQRLPPVRSSTSSSGAVREQQYLRQATSSAPLPAAMASGSPVLGVCDVLQQEALKERCILVDEEDKVIGSTTKEDCHRVQPGSKAVKLHRAFSVFLFNSKGEMLIQRRSKHKVSARTS